jgi:hydrogenase maturation protease
MPDDILVIGYGNTLRGDDGIGPAVVNEIAALGLPGVRTLVVPQLTPELAAEVAAARMVVFVDAGIASAPTRVIALEAHTAFSAIEHAANPQTVLGVARAAYGQCPEAWLVSAAGADFGFHESLSPVGSENARLARAWVEMLLRRLWSSTEATSWEDSRNCGATTSLAPV